MSASRRGMVKDGMASPALTRGEIEAGRKLFTGDWQFVAAAGTPAALPPMRGIEIAFAGRSNCGKSSLINALSGRKALARVSHTPGRTQELIFFAGPPFTETVAPPSLASIIRVDSFAAIHMSWLSPCGTRIGVHVLPASVDLLNPTLSTYTVSFTLGSAYTRV